MMDDRLEPMDVEGLMGRHRWLCRLVRSLIQDEHQTEDVVQHTWLRALEHPPAGGPPGTAWLARVARNLVATLTRREADRSPREQKGPRPSGSEDPQHLAEEVSRQRTVAQAVLELDEPLRSSVLLKYYGDLTSRQIAERLDVPEGTVRSRQKHALEILRQKMSAHFGERGWQAMLLPLAGTALSPTTAAATGSLTLMSTKLKLMCAAALLLISALAVTPFLLEYEGDHPAEDQGVEPRPPNASPSTSRAGSEATSTEKIPAINSVPFAGERALVTGRVVDQVTGQAIANASIKLQHSERWAVAPVARTDEKGRFSFQNVRLGHYLLTPSWNEDLAITGRRVGLTVNTTMPPAVVFEARLGYLISGVLLEAVTKRPLANILLTYETEEKTLESLARTDETGRFKSSKHLPAGRGRILTSGLPNWNGAEEAELLRIDLGSDPHENIDIVYAHAGVIQGIVLGTDGEPAPGRSVRIHVQGVYESPFGPTYRSSASCSTGADGRFRFKHLPMVANFRVTAYLGDGVARASGVRADVTHLARDLILGPDRNTGIDGILRFHDGSTAAGIHVHTVRMKRLANGGLRTTGGHPIVVTGAAGRFEIGSLQPGTYVLSASSRGHYWGGDLVEVIRGQRLAIEIAEHQLLRISGVVGPASEAPPSGGRVRALLRKPLGRQETGMNPSGWRTLAWDGSEATVGEDGSFQLEDLPPGEYRIQARGPSQGDDFDFTPLQKLRQINASGDPIQVRAGSSGVRLNWKRRVKKTLLIVHVFEAGTGNRIVDGQLQLVAEDRSLFNEEGFFWSARIDPGRHLIAAVFSNHAPLLIPVNLPDNGQEVHEIRIKARKGRRIEGVVQTTDKQPVFRALVSVQIETGVASGTSTAFGTLTDLNGHFVLENAPAYGGSLKVVAPFRKPQTFPIRSAKPVITLPIRR